jgi:hypothetical protein
MIAAKTLHNPELGERGVTEIWAPEAGTPLFLTTDPAVSFDGVSLGIALD